MTVMSSKGWQAFAGEPESRPTTANPLSHPVLRRCLVAIEMAQKVYMRLISYVRPRADCRTVFGARMHCRSRDFIQRRIRHFGIFEHNLTYFTLQRLRRGDVYLDIGANVGYFTLLAAGRVGDAGRVIAIEPDPETFAALGAKVRLNGFGNVTALNVAATGAHCRVSVVRTERRNSGSNEIAVRGDGTVRGLPFHELAGSDIGRISFIKIDVEGSEAPILRAILEALPELPSDLVVAAEVSPASADLVARFVEADFRVHALQNVYTIDYYLLRSYLEGFGEERSIHLRRVDAFDPGCRDYVFERRAARDRAPRDAA